MRITSVNIPEGHIDDGLKEIKMDRLGQVVVLAGRNGSGKTRILDNLQATLAEKPGKTKVQDSSKNKRSDTEMLKRWTMQHENLISKQGPNETNDIKLKDDISNANSILTDVKTRLDNCKKTLDYNFIETSEKAEGYRMTEYVPRSLDLIDPNNCTKNAIMNNVKSIEDNIGLAHVSKGTLAQIQHIQDRWREATHQNKMMPSQEEKRIITDYERLLKFIKDFLGAYLSRNSDGHATLFGLPIGQAKLSAGQKVLLQICMAIYSHGNKLEDAMIILDEPENHLHPAALIEVVDRLKALLKNGQIWIATHSVPLLAHCDLNSIWYVKDGAAKHSGKNPEQVLRGLLGGEKGVEKINSFTSHPAQFATAQYAFECLFPSAAVFTESDDPQSNQIHDVIKQMLQKKGNIRILDYGAGKGRTLANLCDLHEDIKNEFSSKIDYVAFDQSSDDEEMCCSVVEQVYGSSDKKYFNKIDDIQNHYDSGSFDIVLMCNVLHEIHLAQWLNIFEVEGEVSDLLSDTGHLLLVEDHVMPTGEKAYTNGFMVFDTAQLKKLFQITSKDNEFEFHEAYDGRLKAHIIPKRCLTRINDTSRKAALTSMSKRAKREIIRIRKLPTADYKDGQQHAFWVQQLANASLYLSEFGTDTQEEEA